jgi:hypothetical protein
MTDARGGPHSFIGLYLCPGRLQVRSTRSNRYLINALQTRRRVPFRLLAGRRGAPDFLTAVLLTLPSSLRCSKHGVARPAVGRDPAADRPDDMLGTVK